MAKKKTARHQDVFLIDSPGSPCVSSADASGHTTGFHYLRTWLLAYNGATALRLSREAASVGSAYAQGHVTGRTSMRHTTGFHYLRTCLLAYSGATALRLSGEAASVGSA